MWDSALANRMGHAQLERMTNQLKRAGVAAAVLLFVACGPEPVQEALELTAGNLPEWEVDPTWPPTLPNDWILGDIRGLFVDENDHLWVVHMPSSLTPQEIGAAQDPPIADCCLPAPPVLELDPEGNVIQAWGGPGEGYTWFDQEHGIYIDHNGFVWLGTSNGFHVMKFTQAGEHVLTIGEPGVNMGSNDPTHLGGPANFFVEPSTNELFIADGYSNRRVVVFDAETGEYRRHWGAYGQAPTVEETHPEAYALYLQARHLGRQFTAENVEQSNALYERALEIDPDYSAAWAGLANNYSFQAGTVQRPIDEGFRLAREAANRALAIDPENAEAHASLGQIEMVYDGDLAAAARHLERALALAPTNPDIITVSARLAQGFGRPDEAIDFRDHRLHRTDESVHLVHPEDLTRKRLGHGTCASSLSSRAVVHAPA